MATFDSLIKKFFPGRPRREPVRETMPFPTMYGFGADISARRLAFKPTPRNLRMFSRTPVARRAINTIKNPIAMMEWEVVPREGVEGNSELRRQCQVVTNCLASPNEDDSFLTFVSAVMEDFCCGAAAIELETSSDQDRPLWMWPVNGLSIQVAPLWSGKANETRYVQTLGGAMGYQAESHGIPLRNDELIYIRPNIATDTPFGHGPLEIAFQTISRQLGVADYAGKASSNALPKFGINLAGADPLTVAAFRTYWTNDIEGEGKIPIWGRQGQVSADGKAIGDGVVKLYPSDDAGLYLGYQEFLKRDVANAFDISPQNLGIERDVNRNTAEVAEDRDWANAIVPAARLFAAHLNREAIRGRLGFSQIEFRWKGLQRDDEMAAAQIDEILYKVNALTADDIRKKRGEPPSDGLWGDKYAADVEIAVQAARGAGQVDDPSLPPAKPAAPQQKKPAPEPGKSKGKP